ncbi:MAG: chemotaxis protein CheW [Syntrophobacteraceae bacterium]|jgi:purine-binding chemotaxis protein CheW
MKESVQLVAFMLDEQRYGLRLSVVERVVRAVEVISLPSAPDIVMGVINLAGQVVPVVNIRRRFRLPEKELSLDDRLIIAKTARLTVALLVDSASSLVEVSTSDVIHASNILPRIDYIDGVATLEDGMLLIHDLDKFLSLEEERALDAAMTQD